MAGLPRAAKGAPPPRKQSIRPAVRPPPIRTQSSTRIVPGKTGEISPTDSIVSTKSNCNSASKSRATSKSRSQSPPSRKIGGTKRKERDFEDEGNSDTNIHVVVRCRGRNDREVRENSGVVVTTDGVKGKNVELSMGPSALSNKTYRFDKVFSPAADQLMIYEDVVVPILNEVSYITRFSGRFANVLSPDASRFQLYYLCIRSNRHGKNLHDVGRHVGDLWDAFRRGRYHTQSSALLVH